MHDDSMYLFDITPERSVIETILGMNLGVVSRVFYLHDYHPLISGVSITNIC